MKHSALLTMLGLGRSPVAPGTVGSVATVALWWAVSLLPLVPGLRGALALALVAAAARYGKWALEKRSGTLDRPEIVLDEFAGMTIALVPVLMLPRWVWIHAIVAFLLFRALDIGKPFGIRSIDRRNTPASVFLDDIAAGALAAVILALLQPAAAA